MTLLGLYIPLACAGFIICASALRPEDYHVKGLSEYGATDDMYAGYMPLNLDPQHNNEGSYFFWLAKRRNNEKKGNHGSSTSGNNGNGKEKLVVWLNGGPGCSSMVGMMWENGPFTISEGSGDKKYSLKRNPSSWNDEAHMLFLEQPIRTGFSQAAKKAHKIVDEHEVAVDFYRFMQSFLKVFTEFQTLPFFITGESYAGAYIPWMADRIVRLQLDPASLPPDAVHINLEGVAIGNGEIDFVIQEASYAEYGYHHGLIPRAAKVKFETDYNLCMQGIEDGTVINRGKFTRCDMMSKVLEAAGYPNEYNTNTFKSYDAVSNPEGLFHHFMNDADIQNAIHVRGYNIPGINFKHGNYNASKSGNSSITSGVVNNNNAGWFEPGPWQVCNDQINDDFVLDHPTTAVPALQFIAEHIRVLLYNGEFDLNCNFIGTLRVLETNLWLGRSWDTAKRSLWKYAGEIAGEHFTIDNLSFIIVRNSGHLLPMDIPEVALDMMHRFLNDLSFRDLSLPSEASYGRPTTGGNLSGDEGSSSSGVISGKKHDGGDGTRGAGHHHHGGLSGSTVLIVFVAVMLISIVVFRSLFKDRINRVATSVGSTTSQHQSSSSRSLLPTHKSAMGYQLPLEDTRLNAASSSAGGRSSRGAGIVLEQGITSL